MAKLLVLKNDKINYTAGDIIEIRANGHPLSDTEKIDFITVNIPDLLISDLEQYRYQWIYDLEFNLIAHQVPTDGYRFQIVNTTVNVSGIGKVTLNDIEKYLDGWNAILNSHGDNYVTVDASTYLVATSKSFWGRDIAGVIFNEEDYNTTTGVHTISADYSSIPWGATAVERYLNTKDIIILSHDNKIIAFEIQGTGNTGLHNNNVSVIEFKQGIRGRKNKIIKRSRYYFDDDIITSAIDSEVILTESDLISEIKDKLED